MGDSSPTVMLSKPWLESSLGSSCADVDVDGKQVADRIVIFGAAEAAEGIGAAGIRLGRGGAVEQCFDPGDHRVVGSLVGPRRALGRHVADAQLAHHLLPDFGFCAGIVGVQVFQREAAGLQARRCGSRRNSGR